MLFVSICHTRPPPPPLPPQPCAGKKFDSSRGRKAFTFRWVVGVVWWWLSLYWCCNIVSLLCGVQVGNWRGGQRLG